MGGGSIGIVIVGRGLGGKGLVQRDISENAVPEVTCWSAVCWLRFCGNIEAPNTMVVVARVAPPSVCKISTIDLSAPACHEQCML